MSHITFVKYLRRGASSGAFPLPRSCKYAMTVAAWTLLFILLVTEAVSALPTVTGATFTLDSNKWCINNTFKIQGTELDVVKAVHIGPTDAAANSPISCTGEFTVSTDTVSCKTTMAQSARAGLYPVTLVLKNGEKVEGGSLAMGALLQTSGVAGWTKTTPSTPHKVTGQSSDWPSTGDAWSIDGAFDPERKYKVIFYNIESDAAEGNPSSITCDPVTVTETKLQCTIISANDVMGMFNFLVRDVTDNALLLGSTSLGSIAVNPPLPVVTSARGSCATSSASCISGAELEITGTNFNSRSSTYQKFFVGVTSAQQKAIRLDPISVSKSNIKVKLTVDKDVPAGSYPVFVKVQVCTMGMMSPLYYVGTLVLGSDSSPGYMVDGTKGLGTKVVSGFCYDGNGFCLNTIVTLTGFGLSQVQSVSIDSTTPSHPITCDKRSSEEDRTMSCQLTVPGEVAAGLYPVTLVLKNGEKVEGGSLAIGEFLEASGVAGWTKTTPSTPHKVTGQSSDWPSTGDAWSIDGAFDPERKYKVIFYNIESDAAEGNPSSITCDPVTVTETKLQCTIISANDVMGMFNFLVRDVTDNALLLGSTSLGSIAVNPPLPVVTSARGSCATSSASCISGAELEITGTNFNSRSSTYQKFFVGVTKAQQKAIRLDPISVSKNNIKVKLTVDKDVPAGSYPVFVKVQVCTMGMMSPLRYVGNLVLKLSSTKGFVDEMPEDNPSESNPSCRAVDGKPVGYITAVILASVFGVMVFLLLITLTFLCMRRTPLRHVSVDHSNFWRNEPSEHELEATRKVTTDESSTYRRC